MPSQMKKITAPLCALILLFWGVTVTAGGVTDLLERPATRATVPTRAVLLDITGAGPRLVAVGERGLVILSDDQGRSWRQAQVPTSVSLTGVTFAGEQQGWAIGHAGIVLHTRDGGETWQKQFDGMTAARSALAAAAANAERLGANHEKAQLLLQDARYLVEDGPDKPFLDLAFTDEQRGFIVGAYNLIFHTSDGGRNWEPWLDRVDNPRCLHFYAIEIVGDTIFLAGEQGLCLRSTDAGAHFQQLTTPYEGTYFTLAADTTGNLILGGLRGNLFYSSDWGETFSAASVPVPVSFSAITRGRGTTLYFANQAGMILVSDDGGRRLTPLKTPHLPPLAAIMAPGNGVLLSVGWGGVIPVPLASGAATGGRP